MRLLPDAPFPGTQPGEGRIAAITVDLYRGIRYFLRFQGGHMKIRNTLRIPIGFIAGIFFLWSADPTPRSFLFGTLIMLFGETIRFVSAGTLIKFEGVTRNGIYAFVRNPLYLGSFFMGAGACIAGRTVPFAIVFLALFPVIYLRVIRREETWLTGRYGDAYVTYLREVPRIVPRRIDAREIFRETSPFLAVKNRELRTVAGLAAVIVFMAVKLVA